MRDGDITWVLSIYTQKYVQVCKFTQELQSNW